MLDLWRTKSLTSRGVFSLSYLPSLVELDIGWCSNVDASSGCLVALANGCKNLQRLILPAQRQLSDRDVFAFKDNLLNLQQLNIMGTRNVSPASVNSLADSLSSLKLLDIGHCEQLEDAVFLSELRANLPDCHIISSFNLE